MSTLGPPPVVVEPLGSLVGAPPFCYLVEQEFITPGFAATRFLSTRLDPRHRILVTHLLQALNIPYCVIIFAFLNRSLCC